jgi:antitoxin (DNA-binding transcriptional repressor) of toxin-antitoxin stability system
MTKDVAIEELREKLDEVMEDVEHGVTINVIRAGRSVATLAPSLSDGWIDQNGLRVRPAKGSWRDVVLPPPLEPEIDITQYLDEERGDR